MFPDKKDSFSNYSIYGSDAVTLFADAAGKLIEDGKEVTRESIREQLEKYDGSGPADEPRPAHQQRRGPPADRHVDRGLRQLHDEDRTARSLSTSSPRVPTPKGATP